MMQQKTITTFFTRLSQQVDDYVPCRLSSNAAENETEK
jgi:hypothetical protein